VKLDLGARGQRLWDNLLAQDVSLADELNPTREVALTACRTADRVEELERQASEVDPVVEGRVGPMIHPLYAEVRQQAALLARLVAALRLPDSASGRRPQHRQVRGVQQPSSVASIDRLRSVKSS
jgi:hypothetical protein